ncbi:Protein of unknown function [Bacillus wiedmannii]|uniref:Uncharacterized protein n=1 Tax=Bacillus wiedmannii TaxID=1890302 RepID=A0AB37YN80_9BACI|nr:Protein of unknown function [Bacillus wiedmannii]
MLLQMLQLEQPMQSAVREV